MVPLDKLRKNPRHPTEDKSLIARLLPGKPDRTLSGIRYECLSQGELFNAIITICSNKYNSGVCEDEITVSIFEILDIIGLNPEFITYRQLTVLVTNLAHLCRKKYISNKGSFDSTVDFETMQSVGRYQDFAILYSTSVYAINNFDRYIYTSLEDEHKEI